jgi:outer membrane protein assembly factor BamB
LVANPLRRPRLLVGILAAILLLGAGTAAALYFTVLKDPGDFSNPDVPFVDEAEPTPEPEGPPRAGRDRSAGFAWPRYGYTKDHRRVYTPPRPLKGPFRQVWRKRAPALTEFPPAIWRGRILQLADNGRLAVWNKDTGKRLWKRKLGSLSASTPAVEDGRVFVTLLKSAGGTGRIVALRLRDGKTLWARRLASRSESSPLVDDGRVYFGSEGGTLYAMDVRNGKLHWTYRAAGAIKGSPTLSDGLLYFGDYGGQVQAVRARDGARIWATGAARRFLSGGNFYATAAVAFGRVYIGATDGRVYSLSAKDGRVAWAHQTGRFVYSSAAVQNVPGAGPTVFVGSYDGTLYALSARTGGVRWRYRSGGKISGSPTIIGDTVYFADLGRAMTFGLRTRDGQRVFRYEVGAYDPAISDGRHLFITGNRSLTALLPRGEYLEQRARKRAVRKHKRQKARQRREEKRKAAAPWPDACRQLAPCGPLMALKKPKGRPG